MAMFHSDVLSSVLCLFKVALQPFRIDDLFGNQLDLLHIQIYHGGDSNWEYDFWKDFKFDPNMDKIFPNFIFVGIWHMVTFGIWWLFSHFEEFYHLNTKH